MACGLFITEFSDIDVPGHCIKGFKGVCGLQPTPVIFTMTRAQLSHKHMINVFEDDSEIKSLMTANEGNICNRAAELPDAVEEVA